MPISNCIVAAKVAFVVNLESKQEKVKDTEEFLLKGYDLVQNEPETFEWIAARYAVENKYQYAIVDTFPSDCARNAHLYGPIGTALKANIPTLLVGNPDILYFDVLASVLRVADITGLKVGLKVLITAKSGKEQEVKQFLEVRSPMTFLVYFPTLLLQNAVSLVKEETFTPVWYALNIRGTPVFAIVDFFAKEEDRQSHVNGKVAAALFANADTLLVKTPEIAQLEVMAWKAGGKKGVAPSLSVQCTR
jgi:quinol monooxygenase YgiN